jgi:hypothetical protein
MDERRDPPPADESSRPVAAGVHLSPLQEAYAAYVDHATRCDSCRSLRASECDMAGELWRAYRASGAEAFRRLREA